MWAQLMREHVQEKLLEENFRIILILNLAKVKYCGLFAVLEFKLLLHAKHDSESRFNYLSFFPKIYICDSTLHLIK